MATKKTATKIPPVPKTAKIKHYILIGREYDVEDRAIVSTPENLNQAINAFRDTCNTDCYCEDEQNILALAVYDNGDVRSVEVVYSAFSVNVDKFERLRFIKENGGFEFAEA